jgi:hypothetical protein
VTEDYEGPLTVPAIVIGAISMITFCWCIIAYVLG